MGVSGLRLFLAELRRRKVYRVAAVYAVVAFVIWQVADVAFEPLHLPPWALTFVVVLVIIGFPLALVLAWALEITPEGIQRTTTEASPADILAADRDRGQPEAAEPQRASIAVLPFADMSPEKDQEYFCDGMAEELINALTKVKELRVVARTSSFQFKGRSEDVREIGTRLGVGSVLEGSVRRAGDRLRVAAQLVNAQDGYHLWSESYERKLQDVFAIQDEISRSIVDTLRPTLVGEPEGRLVKASTGSTEAYDSYLRGRYYFDQPRLETALEYFERAVEIDPSYALAHRGIADCYTVLGLYEILRPQEARAKAEAAIRRALDVDAELAEVHASLGWLRFWYGWQLQLAEEEYARAIELNPGNAEVHTWLALLYAAQGRFDEACERLAIAEQLDPLSSYTVVISAVVRIYAGDLEGAVRNVEDVLRRDPGYLLAPWEAAQVYSFAGRYDDAVVMAERAVSLGNQASFFKGTLAAVYARAGKHERARAILGELGDRMSSEYIGPLWLALSYTAMGEKEAALEYLANAVDERSPFLVFIHHDPAWDPIRSEPRFAELAKQVGSGRS